MGSNRPAVSATVARYLLYATVGLLALEAVIDVGSRVSLGWLALVTAGAFGLATVLERFDSETVAGSGEQPPAVRPPSSRVVGVILLGLCIAGGLLRVYALGDQSFWFDEAISANAAIALLEDGRPTFPSGYTYWRAFPHTLVVAGSMAVFGTGEAAARFPSVLFGVATIGATYWLGREVGGWRVGLLAAVLVTFATWEIAWSRQARMYQQFQLLYTLSLVLLIRVERTWFDDRRAVGALLIVGALAAATHQIGYVLLPVGVAYLGFASSADGRISGHVAGGILIGSLAFVAVLEFIGGGDVIALEGVAVEELNYWSAYLGWLVGELHGFVYLGIVGATLTLYRGWHRTGILLLLSVIPAVWVLSFHTELFATRYLYFGVPVLFLWIAVTIDYIAVIAVEQSRAIGRRLRAGATVDRGNSRAVTPYLACLLAVGIAVSLALGGGFTVMPQTEYELGTNAPQPEFAAAYEHVNENREDGDVIVAGWTAPGVYYAGGVDYWLAHDLTGTENNWTVNDRDRYAGAEPVETSAELEAVLDEYERGWIVVDGVTVARQDEETRAVLESSHLEHEQGGVAVYSWDRSDDHNSPRTTR